MNYIKHLTGFFEKVATDRNLNPTHISLYMSLFQFWNCNRFKNPISISRDEIMRISKISSKATYHKCLKALHHQGYIKYEPSFNPFKGSHVIMFNFSEDLKPQPKSTTSNFNPVIEQVVDKLCTTAETSKEQLGEQVVVPYINNTNKTNILNISKRVNLGEQAKKIEEVNVNSRNEAPEALPNGAQLILENETNPKEKSSVKKEKVTELKIPDIEGVLTYFRLQEFPELEANKFFNYFKSIGWLVGGKTPMTDWKSAANNWMLNAPKFISHERTDRTKKLDTSAGKNYSEPL